MTAPAALSRATAAASAPPGPHPRTARAALVGSPATSKMSLIATGTPWSGPRNEPSSASRVSCSACWWRRSRSTMTNAWTLCSTASTGRAPPRAARAASPRRRGRPQPPPAAPTARAARRAASRRRDLAETLAGSSDHSSILARQAGGPPASRRVGCGSRRPRPVESRPGQGPVAARLRVERRPGRLAVSVRDVIGSAPFRVRLRMPARRPA